MPRIAAVPAKKVIGFDAYLVNIPANAGKNYRMLTYS